MSLYQTDGLIVICVSVTFVLFQERKNTHHLPPRHSPQKEKAKWKGKKKTHWNKNKHTYAFKYLSLKFVKVRLFHPARDLTPPVTNQSSAFESSAFESNQSSTFESNCFQTATSKWYTKMNYLPNPSHNIYLKCPPTSRVRKCSFYS